MTTPHDAPHPSADELQRFEEQLPAWLSGHLDAADAQWMETLQRQYPALHTPAQDLLDLRNAVREAVAHESTDAAWNLLMQKMAAETASATTSAAEPAPAPTPAAAAPTRLRPAPPRTAPRWLAWLWEHSHWANACAAAAVVALVAPTAWMVSHTTTPAPGSTESTTGGAWRSSPLDQLQPAAPQTPAPAPSAQAPWLEIQLQPDAPAQALADIQRLLGADAHATWQPQSTHTWVLHTTAAAAHSAAVLRTVQAHPAVVAVRWLPDPASTSTPSAPAAPAPTPRPSAP